MSKLEKRIKKLVKSRPGIRSSEMIEYFGMNPKKILLMLENMKKKGTIDAVVMS